MHDTLETQSRQPYQIAATCVLLALTIPSVFLRLWVRRFMTRTMGTDDWMMILALIFFIMYNIAILKIVENGGGTHIEFGELNIRPAVQWTVTNEVFYLVSQISLKLSLGFFFLRVVLQQGQRRFIIGTIAFCTLNNTAHVFYVIFRCGNPRYIIEKSILGTCSSTAVAVGMGYEQAAVSTVTDLIFAFMPIPLLWNANMDRRSKISAGLILSMGAFGGICSIVRFLYIHNLAFGEDFFWSAVNISIWSTIELGMGIVAGSLATLRPLLKRVVRSTQTLAFPTTRPTKDNKQNGSWDTTGKVPVTWESPESLPSVFRPWNSTGGANGFTTTCQGPCKVKQVFNWGSMNRSRNDSKNRSVNASKMGTTLDTADQDRAAIWPIDEEMGGIAKVVDVKIEISDAPVESEGRPSRGSRMSEEIRGLWKGRKDDENIWLPERPSPTIPARASDWDRMPDMQLARSHSSRTPQSSSGTSKSAKSSSMTKAIK